MTLDVRPFKGPGGDIDQAVKMTEDNGEELARWCNGEYKENEYNAIARGIVNKSVTVQSKLGFNQQAVPGMWVVRKKDRWYAHNDLTFRYLYREVK